MSASASVFETTASPETAYLMTYRLQDYVVLMRKFLDDEQKQPQPTIGDYRELMQAQLKIAQQWAAQPVIAETGCGTAVVARLQEAEAALGGQDAKASCKAAYELLGEVFSAVFAAKDELVKIHGDIPSNLRRQSYIPVDVRLRLEQFVPYSEAYSTLKLWNDAQQNTPDRRHQLLRAAQKAGACFMALTCETAGSSQESLTGDRDTLLGALRRSHEITKNRSGRRLSSNSADDWSAVALFELYNSSKKLFGETPILNGLLAVAQPDSMKREYVSPHRDEKMARPDDCMTVQYVQGVREGGMKV